MRYLFARIPAIAAVLLVLVPAAARGELRQDIYSVDPDRNAIVSVDDKLGYIPRPFVRAKHDMFVDGRLALTTTYRTDGLGRRVTPLPGGPQRKHYALFFGCSVTFGDNVNDDETLPFYFGRSLPDYEPYNYGYSGYGTQQMLAILENRKIRGEIRQKDGIIMYSFIDHHVQRATGSLQVLGRWNEMPCYEVRGDGRPVNRGLFSKARPLRSRVSRMLFKNDRLSRLIGQRDFPPVSRRDIRFICSLIERSRQLARAQLGNDNFYVLVWRGASSGNTDYLLERLRRSGIHCIDGRRMRCFDGIDDAVLSLPDGHPSPLLYRLMAAELAKELKTREGKH